MPLDYVLGAPIIHRRGQTMVRLADDARECVIYIGKPNISTRRNRDDDIAPLGTGFLIHMGGPAGSYLITARHVVERDIEPLAVRLNDKEGGAENDYPEGRWYFHPSDENVDVAVMPYDPPEWAKYQLFPAHSFLSEFKRESKNIGPGDLAYISGVFSPLHGKTRNIPIVHTGNIALFPEGEPIPVRDWRDETKTVLVDGYLVEAFTLPGLSGSPVFVRRTIERCIEDPGSGSPPDYLKSWRYGSVWLLGLWQGAWMARPGRELARIYDAHAQDIEVSVGVGVVVPAVQVRETLDHPELIAMRKAAHDEGERSRSVVLQADLSAAPRFRHS